MHVQRGDVEVVKRLFTANETFRGRVRTALIQPQVTAVRALSHRATAPVGVLIVSDVYWAACSNSCNVTILCW